MIDLPVLDVEMLNAKQIGILNDAFDTYSKHKLMRIKHLYKDPTRIALDHAVLNALEIPTKLDDIRVRFCKEPHMLKGKANHDLF